MEALKLKTLDDLLASPEEGVEPIAHQLDGHSYRVVTTKSAQTRASIPPLESVELDLAYIVGEKTSKMV